MAIYFIPNLDQISVPPLDVDNIPVSSEIKEVIKDALSELNSSIATNKADISRALVQLEELKNATGGANIEEIKELISVAKDESIAKSVIDDNALKAEILPKIEGVESLVDSKLGISLYDSDKASFATKDELSLKADINSLDGLATKDELATKLDISLYNGDKASFATKDELSLKADISNLATLATKDELNQYALKSEIGGGSVNGATYTQLVATMKYLGYELPSQLRAYADYNLYADDRLSGDLTIGFTPITYAGSYGQAWENVAIYNESGEKLVAKYASISGDGLNIEAIFAKDIPHPKGDSWEAVPSDYALLDGEVRVSITLGAVSYYGATRGLRMLNNNPSDWSQSFLAGVPTVDEWIFTFHNYKPTKFSVTNGTHTYGSYGYMTKYNMRLSIGNWSKTLTYENSSYPNDIEIDFTNLNFGSDEKTIELAKAWNVPVTQYDINQDINNQ
ncbi:hypothetical protein [Campylobacter devanensis]|uniref:hypothetical protein n=1 Tax=Campylobacter devanensis TaxID=3161138 RepID=UPI000A3423A2|nr:hypothetical protein [Campylobacter sp. P148]